MLATSRSAFLSAGVNRLTSGTVPKAAKFLGVRHFGIIGDTVTKMASNKMEGDKGMVNGSCSKVAGPYVPFFFYREKVCFYVGGYAFW